MKFAKVHIGKVARKFGTSLLFPPVLSTENLRSNAVFDADYDYPIRWLRKYFFMEIFKFCDGDLLCIWLENFTLFFMFV